MTIKYKITLPKGKLVKNFTSTKLTFTIGKMKSIGICIVKPILKLYNLKKTSVGEYTGKQWVVANNYNEYTQTFTITEDELYDTAYIQIGFDVIGITDEHPLYFNNLMLNEGDYTSYHQPDQSLEETSVYFVNNFFANLYTKNSDSYLEIIRPNYDNFTTKQLNKSKTTILAPHLIDEDVIDSPENLSLEYMNMSDQVIEILR